MNSVVAIVQARVGSTRLPGKVLKELDGIPLLAYMVKRLKHATAISSIVIATTNEPSDKAIVELANSLGINSYCGPKSDVLKRFVEASSLFHASTIVRLTADCPFIDPTLIDSAIDTYFSSRVEYLSNINPPTFPDGLDFEIFSRESLLLANENASSSYDREHVTPLDSSQ